VAGSFRRTHEVRRASTSGRPPARARRILHGVFPAKAGIQAKSPLGARLRGRDGTSTASSRECGDPGEVASGRPPSRARRNFHRLRGRDGTSTAFAGATNPSRRLPREGGDPGEIPSGRPPSRARRNFHRLRGRDGTSTAFAGATELPPPSRARRILYGVVPANAGIQAKSPLGAHLRGRDGCSRWLPCGRPGYIMPPATGR